VVEEQLLVVQVVLVVEEQLLVVQVVLVVEEQLLVVQVVILQLFYPHIQYNKQNRQDFQKNYRLDNLTL
jgi:hypothetical protein